MLANKQDLPSAKPIEEIVERFGLNFVTSHEWHIQNCCAITSEGLNQGFDWITAKLIDKSKNVKKKEVKAAGDIEEVKQ